MNTFSNKRRFGAQKVKLDKTNINYDLRLSSFYQGSSVDNFLFDKNEVTGSVTLTSDITMLFNQKRLDKMSLQSLMEHFDQMSVKNSSLQELRSKLTDEQLSQMIKSRYIQSPSELMAYSEYLVSRYSDLDSELKEMIKVQVEQQQQQQQQQQPQQQQQQQQQSE